MTSTQIRQQFIDFFAGKGHVFVPSSPVVPYDEPTIMFANAGMNQFKPIFLGIESPTDKRVANTQKCIRAGGKHNDLDDVGKDTYHHTFFEMLGNWSFGDYFKKEAIEWAWELLTRVWGIEKDRLHATVFGGDEDDGLPPDTEAEGLWKEVTDINPTHITRWGKKDNFWEMGETGPCGPCSEIHIDLTPDKSGAPLVNKGDPRVIELWNLVFIQFNRWFTEKGKKLVKGSKKASSGQERDALYKEALNHLELIPLPAKHVDTGLGFERLCSVLQGMEAGKLGQFSNYDTDVFVPIFDAIRKRTSAPEYRGMLPTDDQTRDGTEQTRDRKGAGIAKQTRDRKGTDDPEPQASACANSPDSKPSTTLVDSRGLKPAAQRATREQDVGSAVRTNTPDHTQIMIDISYRVIADHVRCLTFALTDGAIPSNEGRGYVLRRILRRAVRYGRQYMNMHEPFLCNLVQPVIDHMSDAFPELRAAYGGKNVERVVDIIRDEETSFLKTFDRGIALFEAAVRHSILTTIIDPNLPLGPSAIVGSIDPLTNEYLVAGDDIIVLRASSSGDGETQDIEIPPDIDGQRELIERHCKRRPVISGEDVFKLHDTYGFPIDLTQQMAEERGLSIDLGKYERLMEEARTRARTGSLVKTDELLDSVTLDDVDERIRLLLVETDDSAKYLSPAKCGAFIILTQGDSRLELGGDVAVFTDKTCFYVEQGGQVSDTGILRTETGEVEIQYVRRMDRGIIVHKGRLTVGLIAHDQEAELIVDPKHRIPTMQNHTSTHLLNWALREVLCLPKERKQPNVQQKGSLVDPEKTRFDFSHNKPLTDQELTKIESLVNERIEADLPVYTKEVDQKKARQINTLRAVFGEKYPDKVRVVSIGANIDDMLADPKNEKWMQYSVEFCGGTHLKTTAEAERFTIITEEGVAKGIRRVVGISGDAAKEAIATGVALLAEAKALADTPEPQASACANAQTVDDLASTLTKFQQKVNNAVLSVQVRRELQTPIAEFQKQVKEQEKERAAASGEAVIDHVASLLKSAEPIDGVTVVVCEVPLAPADKLRSAVDWIRNKTEASAVLLVTVSDKKVTLLAGMSKVVVKRGLKAGDLIREVAPLVGGKGGGRPDMAQGGGSNPGGVPSLLDHAKTWIKAKLS